MQLIVHQLLHRSFSIPPVVCEHCAFLRLCDTPNSRGLFFFFYTGNLQQSIKIASFTHLHVSLNY